MISTEAKTISIGELIQAVLELKTGVLSTIQKGLVYFKTDTDRPYCDDGTAVDQLMMEKHLPEARRNTKVQLDDTGTGNEAEGVLPYTKGGSGISSLAGKANQALIVNATEDGYEFAEVEMIGSDGQVGAETSIGTAVATITAPANAIGCYVQADENNDEDLRLGWGTSSPAVGTGLALLPGQSEFIRTSSDLKVIAEAGASDKVLNYTWVIK